MAILVTPHSEQEEKVLIAFLDSLDYEYKPEPNFGKRQTVEEYNKELEDAVANVKAGNFTTQEQLEKRNAVMVKLTIVWEDEAKIQLKKLYQYIKRDSIQNAVSVKNDIIEKIKKAAIHPESFSLDKYKTNNDESFRAFELHHYRVSYQVTPNEIIVIRIRHTSQSPLQF